MNRKPWWAGGRGREAGPGTPPSGRACGLSPKQSPSDPGACLQGPLSPAALGYFQEIVSGEVEQTEAAERVPCRAALPSLPRPPPRAAAYGPRRDPPCPEEGGPEPRGQSEGPGSVWTELPFRVGSEPAEQVTRPGVQAGQAACTWMARALWALLGRVAVARVPGWDWLLAGGVSRPGPVVAGCLLFTLLPAGPTEPRGGLRARPGGGAAQPPWVGTPSGPQSHGDMWTCQHHQSGPLARLFLPKGLTPPSLSARHWHGEAFPGPPRPTEQCAGSGLQHLGAGRGPFSEEPGSKEA